MHILQSTRDYLLTQRDGAELPQALHSIVSRYALSWEKVTVAVLVCAAEKIRAGQAFDRSSRTILGHKVAQELGLDASAGGPIVDGAERTAQFLLGATTIKKLISEVVRQAESRRDDGFAAIHATLLQLASGRQPDLTILGLGELVATNPGHVLDAFDS